jgi:Protein of unknown function (DUF3761)/Protein of unknown function (DUF732)
MFLRATLTSAAIITAAIGSPSPANAVPALTGPTNGVVTARLPFAESPPCDYRSKRTGECVEGVDDNPVGATAECGDGLYSHSVTRSGTCSHHDGVAEWCPCGSPSNSTLAGTNASQADADQHFLSLLSQIPNVIIIDPAAMTASGRQVCLHLQNGDETKGDAIARTVENTPNGTLGGAAAMVDAAISAYCPQFGG